MTPEQRAHIEEVQRLKSEWDAAKEEVRSREAALGFQPKNVSSGETLTAPAQGITGEGLKALEDAKSRCNNLRRQYYEAVGMPLTGAQDN
jgi:hypothetical protein